MLEMQKVKSVLSFLRERTNALLPCSAILQGLCGKEEKCIRLALLNKRQIK